MAERADKKKGTAVRRRLPGLTVKDGWMEHPFDAAFGVRTSGLVAGRHLKSGHRHDRHATAYYGVSPSVFAELFRRWGRMQPAGALGETTFVDVGAGMARAMLLAAQKPFRRVIGVELNPALVRIARRNLTVWRRTGEAETPLRMVEGDATEFIWPKGRCLAFLFNPFGATVMRRMLASLVRQFANRPGELDLLYVNNEQEGELEMRRGFKRLFSGKVHRSREDAAADRRILSNQPDGEYASAPYEDCSIWRWSP